MTWYLSLMCRYKIMGPVRELVNPIMNPRMTITNGKLIINEPKDTQDNGQYECVSHNRFGSVLSNLATLSFGCKCHIETGQKTFWIYHSFYVLFSLRIIEWVWCFCVDLNDFPKSERDPVTANAYTGVGIECNPPKHSYPSKWPLTRNGWLFWVILHQLWCT